MSEFTDLITISVYLVLLQKCKMNPIWVAGRGHEGGGLAVFRSFIVTICLIII